MGVIEVLPNHVADQIAAGEVVERPASVVKELVENALDAGATRIVIELEDAGKKKILVADNGVGMSPEDVLQSVIRHATSKVRTIEDLLKINSMGFRGEALASVASVSKMTIRSRPRSRDTDEIVEGFEAVWMDGRVQNQGNVGMAWGTTVIVEDLFFNVPARKKFLKSSQTELRAIVDLIESLALVRPEVGWEIKHGTRVLLTLSPATEWMGRIQELWGEALIAQMLEVGYDHPHLQIRGWVGKPQTSQETKVRQLLFVNKRKVQDKFVAAAVKQALSTLLMPRAQVPWILAVDMPLEMVDVNVHPRKDEVRFVNGNAVFRAVYDAIEHKFKQADLRYSVGEVSPLSFRNQGAGNHSSLSRGSGLVQETAAGLYGGASSHFQKTFKFEGAVMSADDKTQHPLKFFLHQSLPWESERRDTFEVKEIIQLGTLYLVTEEGAGVRLIDQHAAHERVRYEELVEQWLQRDSVSAQRLLIPEKISLHAEEILLIEEYIDSLGKIGFELMLEKDAVIILGIPSLLAGVKLETLFREVLGDLSTKDQPELMTKYVDEAVDSQTRRLLTYLACRSAIKGGDFLTLERRRLLLLALENCKRPYTCPHGRPVEIVLTWGELERMFKRSV